MLDLFENDDMGALFSEDRLHRYRLWRIWDKEKPLVMFVGLNPSKANEARNDPTINYVGDFSKKWGYGGFYMMNLFSIVSSDPKILVTCPDPIADNDSHLNEVSGMCKDVVFAWGKFTQAQERRLIIEEMFPNAMCIGKKEGHPYHPLWAGMWAPKSIKETFTHPIKFK